MKLKDRGQVKAISLTIEYPDGTTKVARPDPTKLARILLDPEECEEALERGWKTRSWKTNPAFVVVYPDGTIEGSGRQSDHGAA